MEEWDYSKNKISPSNYFPKSGKFVWWVCPLCDNSYDAPIASRTSAKSACPKCRESKGEKSIFKWLKNNGIYVIQEYKFGDCRDKRKLPFDFYLPDYNVCIEYDGEQHHTVRTNFFGGNDKFKQLKRRDKIKTKYCKDNNIYLLRIPYWDFNNIEQILTETLFS
jgi:very-short-patch-repair endonuclease